MSLKSRRYLRPSREQYFHRKTTISVTAKEKEKKLKSICNEFLTIAFSYGFSTEEIISEIQKHSKK
jgi:GntR family transcriptional regulator